MGDLNNISELGKKTPKERTTITIDKALLEEFTKIAMANNLSKSAIIEELVRFYVDKKKSLI